MIYLASPYTHDNPAVRQWRYEAACRATAELLKRGHVVFSPIVHSHNLVQYGLPDRWDWWAKMHQTLLWRCDAVLVLMLPGWRESASVQEEIGMAKDHNKPVLYRRPATLGIEVAPCPTSPT